MRRIALYFLVFAALIATCWAQVNRLSLASPPQGGVRPKNSTVNSTSQPKTGYNGIDYHGGPVMSDPQGYLCG
jgi:hypothetical protein